MQVQQKPTDIQSFGGINFVNEYLISFDLDDIVLQKLGTRSVLAQYSYADLIRQLFFIALMGGEVLDDSNKLRQEFKRHPYLRIASPDTIEYAFLELRRPIRCVVTADGVTHQINEHAGFNQLLPRLCRKTGLLTTEGYTMDYDGHIVENEKKDNAFTYKKTEGYYPVVCSINKLPVYMQNRNGNTPEAYNQKNIIETAINECAQNGIRVCYFRADACCYEKHLLEYLETLQTPIRYTIRAEMNRGLLIALQDEDEWQDVMIGYQKMQVCSIMHKVMGKQRRIVAYRKKIKSQLNLFEQDGYHYQALVTNDHMKEVQTIEFYNQRGCLGEHHFKELDYDFNWNKLPFDNMEMNTIYMYATMVGYLLFHVIKEHYSKKLSFVNPTMRLKNFVLHFIILPAR